MEITYAHGTAELIARHQQVTDTNATDWVSLEAHAFSVFALYADQPVGVVGAKRHPLSPPLQHLQEVFIEMLEVRPEYRRQGIGSALLEHVFAWAKEIQAMQVRSWSEEIRTEALSLWNKFGFTFSRVPFQRGDEKDRYGFYVAKRL
jgi:GNAT superfamily N-acetyltransferase